MNKPLNVFNREKEEKIDNELIKPKPITNKRFRIGSKTAPSGSLIEEDGIDYESLKRDYENYFKGRFEENPNDNNDSTFNEEIDLINLMNRIKIASNDNFYGENYYNYKFNYDNNLNNNNYNNFNQINHQAYLLDRFKNCNSSFPFSNDLIKTALPYYNYHENPQFVLNDNFAYYPNVVNINSMNYYKNTFVEYEQKKNILNFDNQDFSEILIKISKYSKDHLGSRFIQRKFENGSEEERQKIISCLLEDLIELSKDVFGNYVIQKIIEYSTDKQRSDLLKQFAGQICELSSHMYGCRVIQKALDLNVTSDVCLIFNEIKENIEKLIVDQNGNHVVQKLIDRLCNNLLEDITKMFKRKTAKFAMQQYGCRVIQKLIEKCDETKTNFMVNEMLENVTELTQNQYGNYLIQNLIVNKKEDTINKIFDILRNKFYQLSVHKYSSNVVEKLLTHGSKKIQNAILQEIIETDDNTSDSLLGMVNHKYGNYVVQKLIEIADYPTKENIIHRISFSNSHKKGDGFSKHVINFINKSGFSFTS